MEIKQHTLNQWIKEEITREIRKYLELNENKNIQKLMEHCNNNAKGKIFSYKHAYIKNKKYLKSMN